MLDNNLDGLVLILKKHQLGLTLDNSLKPGNPLSFFMFGYHDELQILHTHHWLDLSPRGIEECEKSFKTALPPNDISVESIDYFPIKLLLPSDEVQQYAEKKGFDYDFWSTSPKSPDYSKFPLISVILLNMTDSFLAKQSDPKNAIKTAIDDIDTITQASGVIDLKPMHCAVFQTIGSYDFAILIESDSWNPAFELLESLRSDWKCKPSSNSPQPALSNAYMIPGVNQNNVSNNQYASDTLSLSIRFVLRPGTSAKKFTDSFEKQLSSVKSVKEFSGHIMRGRYDCRISFLISLTDSMKLYQNQQLLRLDGSFKDAIFDTNTSIQESVMLGKQKSVTTSTLPIAGYSAIEYSDYNKMLKAYDEFLDKYKLHRRSERALKQLFVMFSDLNKNYHNHDVMVLLQRAFKALAQNIEQHMDYCEKLSDDDSKQTIIYNHFTNGIDISIKAFREYIGNYMLVLAHSERLFIEGLKISHISIGSSTKLLFAYNAILNEVVASVSPTEKNSYSFVVISGGVDQTITHNVFDGKPFTDEDNHIIKNRLLVTQLPERSTFDICGTLFRTLHEAWHYCGEHYRNERNNGCIQSLAAALANILAHSLFTQEIQEESFIYFCPEKNIINFKNDFKQLLNQHTASYLSNISEYIQGEIHYGTDSSFQSDPSLLYSESYWPEIHEKVQTLFNTNSGIIHKLYRDELDEKVLFYDECIKQCEKYEAIDSVFDLDLASYKYLSQTDEQDQRRINYIQNCLKVIETGIHSGISFEAFDSGANPLSIDVLSENSLPVWIECLKSVYKESFSDTMAIKTLGVDIGTYLFSFVYENWDIDSSLPRSTECIFRIGAVIEVCYSKAGSLDSKDLWNEVKDSVTEHYNQFTLNCNWIKDEISLEELLLRLKLLINDYTPETNRMITDPICSYLKKCINQLEGNRKLKDVQEIYSEALNINRSDNSVYQGLNLFLGKWIHLNKQDEHRDDTNS